VVANLTQSSRRAAAAMLIEPQVGSFAAALLVADTLDAVSAAVCAAAGLDDDTARVVLGDLWQLTPLTDPRNGDYRVVPDTEPCPCECNRGGRCGGCGHAGCGGRR